MTTGPAERPPFAALPPSAWWLGWTFLAGQLVAALLNGFQDESAWPLSILLSVALVVLFSHGVLRARMVRTVIVGVLLGLAGLVELVTVVLGDLGELPGLLLTAAQLGCFVWFVRSPWFAWQRGRPDGGPSVVPVLAIAVAVGVLGGLIGADTAAAGADVDLKP